MNAMRLYAMCWMFAARGLVAVWVATIVAAAAQPAPPISFPKDYRSWQHVRTIVVGSEHRSFATRGGIHHYYANAKAVEGYKTGRFPNGSIVVDEGVLTEDGAGPSKGIVFESDRRSLDVMVKNDQLYAETGGWGFEHFEGDESKGQLDAKRRTQCYECHSKSKDRDHIFSSIRVAKFAPAAVAPSSAPMTASQTGQGQTAQGKAGHSMTSAADLKWSPVSPGISMAILSGSLTAEGTPFVFRLKVADGTRVPPHWHPGDEHLTVLTGTFHMGVGEKFDEAAATAMTPGAYDVMPKEVRHFAWATGETIVQIHGIGPFKTFFVTEPKSARSVIEKGMGQMQMFEALIAEPAPPPEDAEWGRSESLDPDNVGDIADEGAGHRG